MQYKIFVACIHILSIILVLIVKVIHNIANISLLNIFLQLNFSLFSTVRY